MSVWIDLKALIVLLVSTPRLYRLGVSFSFANSVATNTAAACANLKLRETARLAKTSQACAMKDLEILDTLLGNVVQERWPLIKFISPGIFAWYV